MGGPRLAPPRASRSGAETGPGRAPSRRGAVSAPPGSRSEVARGVVTDAMRGKCPRPSRRRALGRLANSEAFVATRSGQTVRVGLIAEPITGPDGAARNETA